MIKLQIPNPSLNINCPDTDDVYVQTRLPTDYAGPVLTVRMQRYIDEHSVSKFHPHTAMRGELLSLLFDDVTKTHQLL